jgi:predicted metal-dependent phosphoesterase TrpH
MELLKADFHIHTSEDPVDKIKYSAVEAIRSMAFKGYECIAITCHKKMVYTKEMREEAGRLGVLLIPGYEAVIEKGHVLIYNCTEEDVKRLKTFSDVRKLKQQSDILVIAPHPCFPWTASIGAKNLVKHIDIFDAIEISQFYNNLIDFNRHAIEIALKYDKALISNSDAHSTRFLGKAQFLIRTEKKDMKHIFASIRENKGIYTIFNALSFVDFVYVVKKVALRFFGFYSDEQF